MEIFHGKSVFGGIAIGKIKYWDKGSTAVKRYHISDKEQECERFVQSKILCIQQLGELYQKACKEVGEENAAIFEIHQMMLEDDDYVSSVENIITTQGLNAEYAVMQTCENFSAMFTSMEDPYMQARAADVKDISERLINILCGNNMSGFDAEDNIILASDDLAPSETVQLDKTKIIAFVTNKGSVNSHTAILARTMNIPAVIGVDLTAVEDIDGKEAIVDGATGSVYIEPDKEILEKMNLLAKHERDKKRLLYQLKGKPNLTIDGTAVKVYANIGNNRDLAYVLSNDADGIGLFRSEFLYLERDIYPTEEEQFAVYKTAVQTMGGKKVIIRTLDIGADKQADYFDLPQEENPAMGMRAIRICLTRPEVFKTQLRALFRAACFGNMSVMYPMITSVKEIKQIKNIVREVTEELSKENIPYSVPEQGIMIETPAAVMISDKLAEEVSFFSIGTNDLSQYAMAIDRQNDSLDRFFEPHSEAVMRMIRLTVDNAHRAGLWVGICGELAADTELTETFLRMGVDELSVSPGRVLPLRSKIREIRL